MQGEENVNVNVQKKSPIIRGKKTVAISEREGGPFGSGGR